MTCTKHGNRTDFRHVRHHRYRRLRQYQITLYVDGAGWPLVGEFLRTQPRLRPQYLPA